MRVPDPRDPKTGNEVIAITLVVAGVMVLASAVFDGPLFRIELLAVTVLIGAWCLWALNRVLKRSTSA